MDINVLPVGIIKVTKHFTDELAAQRVRDQKCPADKAQPEWDFRTFSNSGAFSRDRNAMAVSISQGRNLAVCGTCPLLWVFRGQSRCTH